MDKIHVRFLILFLPIILLSNDLKIGNFRFDHLSTEQGLSNFTVTSIAQDKNGLIWVGTEDGLNLYDGYNFTIYRPDKNNKFALPFQYIRSLYVDSENRLWIITPQKGLYWYDPEIDGFKIFNFDNEEPFLIYQIIEDNSENIWIAAHDHLGYYDRQQKTYRKYQHSETDPNSVAGTTIASLYKDFNDKIWIVTIDGKLDSYDPVTDSFEHYILDQNPDKNLIFTLQQDKNGFLWIGTVRGLYILEPGEKKAYPANHFLQFNSRFLPKKDDFIFTVFRDSKENMWIGTYYNGLFKYDMRTHRSIHYKNDASDPFSLKQDRIHIVFEERSGSIWIVPYRSGVDIYNPQLEAFTRYVGNVIIYSVYKSTDGTLWAGSSGDGLFAVTPEGEIKNWKQGSSPSLPSDNIYAITGDDRGNLWLASLNGLIKFNKRFNRFTFFKTPTKKDIPNNGLKSLFYDEYRNVLWMGDNRSGLFRFDLKKEKFTALNKSGKADSQELLNSPVWSIDLDWNQNLWLATFGNGLMRFNPESREIKHFTYQSEDTNSINNNALYYVSCDSPYIWIGTFGSGLNRLDPRTEKFIHYTVADGFADNFIKAILKDESGNLWLSTDKGLTRFNSGQKSILNFDVNDGLHYSEFMSCSAYNDKRRYLYFGGVKGITAFNPQNVARNNYIPPLVLTDFRVFNQRLNIHPILAEGNSYKAAPIILNYNQSYFSAEFSSLDYSNPVKNQYAYMLEGLNTDWIHLGTRRYVNFINLNPGNYTLRIKGSNSAGTWNEAGLSIPIEITPPYWKTWWFRLISGLSFLGLIFWMYNYRVSKLIQMERLRTRLSADLHDDIAGNLSSIAMYGKIIQNEAGKSDALKHGTIKLLDRIIDLAGDSVNAIRDIIWALDSSSETVNDLLWRFHDYSSKACNAAGVSLLFAPPDMQNKRDFLNAEQKNNLFMVFKEAVNNSIKHSGATRLEIEIFYRNRQLGIKIKDNGCGFDSEFKSNGKGMKTMQNRIKYLNGDFSIRSLKEKSGTEIKIMIRLKKIHHQK